MYKKAAVTHVDLDLSCCKTAQKCHIIQNASHNCQINNIGNYRCGLYRLSLHHGHVWSIKRRQSFQWKAKCQIFGLRSKVSLDVYITVSSVYTVWFKVNALTSKPSLLQTPPTATNS